MTKTHSHYKVHYNFLWLGVPQQHSAEIQNYFLEICHFYTLTSAIHQMKDTIIFNLQIVSNFKKALQQKHNIWLC
jgi:hypothetical protein